VKRREGDIKAMRQALSILNSNRPLVIFPEGTRSKDRELKPAKPGIGFIVAKTNVPVIPAYIDGSFEALPRRVDTFKPHPVRVYIGKPIYFKIEPDMKGRQAYQKISDEIMDRIKELKVKYAAS
jgi:1-acyl-sn-glycerol-3-phosphate acyltransferase